MSRRVVVTGLGAVTPVGSDVPSFWDSLCRGKSGIRRITHFDPAPYSCQIAGEVETFAIEHLVDAKELRRTDRVILFALAASDQALKDASFDAPKEDLTRCGVVIGAGVGGLLTLGAEHTKLIQRGPDRVSPFLIPMMITDMSAGRVSIMCGFKGPNYALVSACASGAHALGDAFVSIKAGMMDVALAGGTEAAITPIGFAGFCNMKALSTRNDFPEKASSPFDLNRDGFVMGEGAGIVVLEELEHALARKARIHCELVGYGATGDAYHISAPSPEGEGMARAMKMALDMAGLVPADIDYINAHGTSTPYNDKNETTAIKSVFGEHARSVAISSTKSMTGHLLGASGGIEFVASALALRDGIIPPTINLETPDPECDLNYTPGCAVRKPLRRALSNSFGFGGHNATLIIGRYEAS